MHKRTIMHLNKILISSFTIAILLASLVNGVIDTKKPWHPLQQIAISEGSNIGVGDVLTIDNGLKVGIGTPTPNNKLEVIGKIFATGDICTSLAGGKCLSTASGGITGSGAPTQVAFFNSGTNIISDPSLYWDNANKRLGIGGAPGSLDIEKLHVFGGIRVIDGGSLIPLVSFYNSANVLKGFVGYATGNNRMLFEAGSGGEFQFSQKVKIGSAATPADLRVTGDLLIGPTITPFPGRKLRVEGTMDADNNVCAAGYVDATGKTGPGGICLVGERFRLIASVGAAVTGIPKLEFADSDGTVKGLIQELPNQNTMEISPGATNGRINLLSNVAVTGNMLGGKIQSTSGGFQFPDGTVQTTAATGGGGAATFTRQDCTFGAGSGAGWKTCYCPASYSATGQYGVNCMGSTCPTFQGGTSSVQFYHDGVATASVGVFCAK